MNGQGYHFFTTYDGVRLRYWLGGTGTPLVILPGLTLGAEDFAAVLPALAQHFQVYCLEYRGHGGSDTPAHGAHIERLAMDMRQWTKALHLESFHLLSHSMGNAVAWCYFSLFGTAQISKYILNEEAPCMLRNPAWSTEEAEAYTGRFIWPDLWAPLPPRPGEGADTPQRKEFLELLFRDHIVRDWRREIQAIRLPTLILMGGGSHFASQRLWNWLHQAIPHSILQVIPAENGGTHEIFKACPEGFTKTVIQFLEEKDHGISAQK